MNKSRIMMSLFVIALAAALIGGATMAWFTAKAEAENEFIAGTVLIDLTEIEFCAENVNPGDCYEKDFTLTNEGTKEVRVRMKLDGEWTFNYDFLRGNWYSLCFTNDEDYVPSDDEIDDMIADLEDPVSIVFESAGWIEGTDGWWYYNSNFASGASMNILVDVCFDGPTMTNGYQKADYDIDVKVEAIQASNDAAELSGWEIY